MRRNHQTTLGARGMALMMALALLLGAPPPAAASEELREELYDWLVRLYDEDRTLGECYDALDDRRVRFQQVTDNDPYLSGPVRERLNQIVEGAMPRSWELMSSAIVGRNVQELEQERALEVLQQLRESGIVLRATVARSDIDVARLKIEVILTDDEGRICDSATRQIHFDTSTLARVAAPPFSASAVDIYDLDATLRDGLLRSLPSEARGAPVVPFVVTSNFFGARCFMSPESLSRELYAAASDVSQTGASIDGSPVSISAYEMLSDEAAEVTPHLQVIATSSPRIAEEDADSAAVITFAWRDGARRLPGVSRIVALPRGALERCEDPIEEEQNALEIFLANARGTRDFELSIAPLKDPFVVGDTLELDFDVSQPVYVFCWSLGPDGEAFGANLIHPRSRRQARQSMGAKVHRIPADFGIPPSKFRGEGSALFHCFVSISRVPDDLLDAWLDAGRTYNANRQAVPWDAVEGIADRFRRIPNMSEVYAWVRIEAV